MIDKPTGTLRIYFTPKCLECGKPLKNYLEVATGLHSDKHKGGMSCRVKWELRKKLVRG